jgi:hypothetical protein
VPARARARGLPAALRARAASAPGSACSRDGGDDDAVAPASWRVVRPSSRRGAPGASRVSPASSGRAGCASGNGRGSALPRGRSARPRGRERWTAPAVAAARASPAPFVRPDAGEPATARPAAAGARGAVARPARRAAPG